MTFSIANGLGDLSGAGNLSYYSGSYEAANFAGSFSNVSAIYAAILNITSGNPSDAYSVLFSDVSNITFSNTDANSNNTFDTNEAVGEIVFGTVTNTYPSFNSNHAKAAATIAASDPDVIYDTQGDIWINTGHESTTWGSGVNSWDQGSIVSGTVAYQALVHEIGHALGLKGDDGLSSSGINSAKYTIMSYVALDGMVDTTQNSTGYANTPGARGLQLYDIAALQSVYGRNYGGDRGFGGAYVDTTYKEGQGFAASASTPFIYTIWDGAGTDVIDASSYTSHHVLIDLRQGHFSSIGNAVEGLSLWLRHCPHLVAWGRFQAATDKMLIAPEATE